MDKRPYVNKVGLIGAGQMAAEIGQRLVRYGGLAPEEVAASHYDAEKAKRFARLTGLRVFLDNRELTERSEVVLLCVRPQQAKAAIRPLTPLFADRRRSLVSIAAGIKTAALARWASSANVAHFHPTSLLMATEVQNPGVSLWAPHPDMSRRTDRALRQLFQKAIGDVWSIPEPDFPRYIFLAGNCPAFVLRVVEAFARAAGLKSGEQDVYQAILSSIYHGVVLEQRHPGEIISRIATRGGVTEAGLHVLEDQARIDGIALEVRDACLQRLRGMQGNQVPR